MWNQIRLLLQDQSNLGLHCLSKRLLIFKQFQQMTKADIFVVIGALRSTSVEPDQTAPVGSYLGLHYLSKRLLNNFRRL